MRILALSPYPLESVSGNGMTLRRNRDSLIARGHEFKALVVSPEANARKVESAIRDFRPDVLHAYHAYKSGRLLPSLGPIPSVVTLAGTDMNVDHAHPDRHAVIAEAVGRARVVLTYSASIARRVPGATVIPKGVTLASQPFDLRATAGIRRDAFLFLQAGGIRPVKNNLLALDALAPLKKEAALVFAGPILDAEYGHQLARRLGTEAWARHLPPVPHDAMAAAYRGCDVVLNTSDSEGISNTLVEAMTCGRPILASDIPGNRDFLEHGVTAALFKDIHGLTDLAAWLIRDGGAREKLGRAARAYALEHFSTERETDALLAAYQRAVGTSTGVEP